MALSSLWWRRAPREHVQSLLVLCIVCIVGERLLSAQPSQLGEPRQRAPEAANQAKAADADREIETAARVVILNLDRSAIGTLVEAKLREKKVVNWWPRTASYQLLREIELSPAIDEPPLGGAQSDTPTGKPPLPDAMILLRIHSRGELSVADLVVCDPKLGLRLSSKRLTLTKNVANDVEMLANAATVSLKKLDETTTKLWGVPPFRCSNLGGADGDLGHLLTQETEQALLKQRGVFVVELDYAYAIAAARKLAGIEKGVSRPRPRYLLGEYRHEPSNAGRQLAMSLTLHMGDSPAMPVPLDPQPSDEAIGQLRKQVGELANRGDFSTELDNPIGEIKLLDVVRREYQKAGNVETQIALAETNLLLIRVEPRLRSETATLLGSLAWQEWRKAEELPLPVATPSAATLKVVIEGSKPADQVQREYELALVRALNHFRRGLSHAATAADSLKAPPPPERVPPNAARLPVVHYGHPAPMPRATSSEALKLMAHQVRVERAKLVLRMARIHAHNGEPGDAYLLRDLPPADRHAMALRLILELKDYPRAEARLQQYVLSGMAMMTGGSPKDDERFLSQVEAIDHPAIAPAVRNAREQLARQAKLRPPQIIAPNAAQPARPVEPTEAATKAADQIAFRPLSLPWKDMNVGLRCELCLPAGHDVDLFCTSGQILMMKNKGEARVIWQGVGLNFRHFLSATPLACYDGKYAWIPASIPLKLPRLVVVDPQTGKVTEVTLEHGLPEGPIPVGRQPVLAAAPISPGKALLVGSFGQTWLAIASFDPDKGPSVKVIHECVEQAIPDDHEQWKSAKLAFEPNYLATLSGKLKESDTIEQRVIVGRAAGGGAFLHPLLVNPETNQVEVLTAEYTALAGAQPFLYEGALYASIPSTKGRTVWRVGFPDFQPDLVAEHPIKGASFNLAIGMEPGRVHLIHDHWYTAPTWDEPLMPLRGKLPAKPSDRIGLIRSNHFGWMVQTLTSEVYVVEFLDVLEKPSSESKESTSKQDQPDSSP